MNIYKYIIYSHILYIQNNIYCNMGSFTEDYIMNTLTIIRLTGSLLI